jgi:ATP-dependent DNA helicase RecG
MQYSWDSYISNQHHYADLDEQKILNFINKVNERGRFSLVGNPKECLEKLRIVDGNKVTNAAILLFAKEEIIHHVHVGRLKTPTLIIDDRIIKKTLFEMVDEIMKYIVSQIKFAFEIRGYPTQRTEIPEYPIEAIRETVLNAVIHRDYLLPYDIQIKIFDKEMTVYNPGKLSGNLTFEDLLTDNYQAYARNKLIAEMFYLTGNIEKYGSGFRRVRAYIEEYPTMKTEFKEVPNGLLFSYSYTIQKNSMTPPYYTSEMLNDKLVEQSGQKSGQKSSRESGQKRDLSDNQVRILSEIENNNYVSRKELSEMIGIAQSAIQKHINTLKEKGLLERIGPAKGGYWKILKQKID